MADRNRAHPRGPRPPPRPPTASNYVPTPMRTVPHTDTMTYLINEEQRSPDLRPMPRERFTSFSQASVISPTTSIMTTNSLRHSLRSTSSALSAATKRFSLNLELGKASLKKKLSEAKKKVKTEPQKDKGKDKDKDTVSRSDSTSSAESLFKRRRLPKLKIPEMNVAVERALHSACSTDTVDSPNFRLLQLSPTSRELKYQWERDHHSQDVRNEFRNMLSARRRVRKGKFGAQVTRYRAARPTWDDLWGVRISNDNHEDRAVLRKLTNTIQEHKDYATLLAQMKPKSYPGLKPVSKPGCTLNIFWQGSRSPYRDPPLRESRGKGDC